MFGYEPKGQGFESLAARQKEVQIFVCASFLFIRRNQKGDSNPKIFCKAKPCQKKSIIVEFAKQTKGRAKRAESLAARHVVTDFVSFVTAFLLKKPSFTHAVVPPFRNRSRSSRLFGCKRPHDGFVSLPPCFG